MHPSGRRTGPGSDRVKGPTSQEVLIAAVTGLICLVAWATAFYAWITP